MPLRARGTQMFAAIKRHASASKKRKKSGNSHDANGDTTGKEEEVEVPASRVQEAVQQTIAEPAPQLFHRMEILEELLEEAQSTKLFTPQSLHISDDQNSSKSLEVHCEQVQALIKLVEERIQRSTNYRKLLGTLCFFLVFFFMLSSMDNGMGANITSRYVIESSIMTKVIKVLPASGGGPFGSSEDDVLSDESEFYSWMRSAIVENIFEDSVCGDGVCDSDEYAGFGRFGCTRDCGRWTNVSTITVKLEDMLTLSQGLPVSKYSGTSGDVIAGWDFKNNPTMKTQFKHNFKWNVYSKSINEFIFDQDISNTSAVLTLPDGEYELRLFQTGSSLANQDLQQVGLKTSVVPSSMKQRDASEVGFSYGEPFEALTQAYLFNEGLLSYCDDLLKAIKPSTDQLEVKKCENFQYAQPEFYYKMLSTYGLRGSVTMKTIGALSSVQTLVSVDFCNALPVGIGTLDTATGGYTDATNKKFAWDSAMACPAAMTRRSLSPEADAWSPVQHLPRAEDLSEQGIGGQLLSLQSEVARLLAEVRALKEPPTNQHVQNAIRRHGASRAASKGAEWEGSTKKLLAKNGKEVCENHGYDEQECKSKGCCEFDDGQCVSAVDDNPCEGGGGGGAGAGGGAGDSGGDKAAAPAPTWIPLTGSSAPQGYTPASIKLSPDSAPLKNPGGSGPKAWQEWTLMKGHLNFTGATKFIYCFETRMAWFPYWNTEISPCWGYWTDNDKFERNWNPDDPDNIRGDLCSASTTDAFGFKTENLKSVNATNGLAAVVLSLGQDDVDGRKTYVALNQDSLQSTYDKSNNNYNNLNMKYAENQPKIMHFEAIACTKNADNSWTQSPLYVHGGTNGRSGSTKGSCPFCSPFGLLFGPAPAVKVKLSIPGFKGRADTTYKVLDKSTLEIVRLTIARFAFNTTASALSAFDSGRVVASSNAVIYGSLQHREHAAMLRSTQVPAARCEFSVLSSDNSDLLQLQTNLANSNIAASVRSDLIAGSKLTTAAQTATAEKAVTMSTEVSVLTLVQVGVNGACKIHYDCQQHLFCKKSGASAGKCAKCNECRVDARDAVDGKCPNDGPTPLCPGTGGLPACIDGKKFFSQNFTSSCKSSFKFEVWNFGKKEAGAPKIIPDFAPKSRTISTNNRVVGAVLVSQKRVVEGSCDKVSSFSRQVRTNAYTQRFSERLMQCPLEESTNDVPYGYDPVFLLSSKIYDGKVNPRDFYGDAEYKYESSGVQYPLGFFPHKYNPDAFDVDGNGRVSSAERSGSRELLQNNYTKNVTTDGTSTLFTYPTKAPNMTVKAFEDSFNLYFDERLSRIQALKMVDYIEDGNYIDSQTKDITVEFVTYNSYYDTFSINAVTFTWLPGGKIEYRSTHSSLSVSPWPDRVLVLFGIVVICLAINTCLELHDLFDLFKKFQITDYISDIYNYLDWSHFLLMWYMAILFIDIHFMVRKFSMPETFPVLFYGPVDRVIGYDEKEDVHTVSKAAMARMFRPNVKNEKAYLDFLLELHALEFRKRQFTLVSGMAFVLFIFRMLKNLNFQPRMGLVTRTIEMAFVDLFHFMILYSVVLLAYAYVGYLIFGHQYSGMSTFDKSMSTLFILMMNFDPSQFWLQMMGAGDLISFHIFLWTYMIVTFFILLNMLLAIICDSYAAVKEETSSTDGLITEMSSVIKHAVRRWHQNITRSDNFVSDQHLLVLLQHELHVSQSQEFQNQAKRDLVKKALARSPVVLLPGGLRISKSDISRMVGLHGTRYHNGSTGLIPVHSKGAENSDEEAFKKERDRLLAATARGADPLNDLMERYGTDEYEDPDRRGEELLELLTLENTKRTLSLQLGQLMLLDQSRHMFDILSVNLKEKVPTPTPMLDAARMEDVKLSDTEVLGKLTVNIQSASNLPKLDLLRPCDGYCVVWIDYGPQPITCVTNVIEHNANPTWNEIFSWDINCDTSTIFISVWDKDRITADDLVGCVSIDLDEVAWGTEVPITRTVVNPALKTKIKDTTLSVIVTKSRVGAQETQAAARFDENQWEGGASQENISLSEEAAMIMDDVYRH